MGSSWETMNELSLKGWVELLPRKGLFRKGQPGQETEYLLMFHGIVCFYARLVHNVLS